MAFLQSKIDSEVYVGLAPGQEAADSKTGVPLVMKLKRNQYGPAQSRVRWYDTIDAALRGIGLTLTLSGPCVYTHGSDDTFAILIMYVDDIVITGRSEEVVKRLKKALMDRFAMTDMGEVSRFLGMAVTQDYDAGPQATTQTDYVKNVLERFGMLDCNPVHTPVYGPELSNELPEEKLLSTTGVKLNQGIVGLVLHLAQVTRYNICYAVYLLTRACSKPVVIHLAAAKHILRYLKEHPDLAIVYKRGQVRMTGCTDASFAANPDNRKSTSGFIFMCGGPIGLGAKTQSPTAQSTVEAELMAISFVGKEATYLSNFILKLGFKPVSSVPINCDRSGALHVAGNSTYSSRTKNIALRFFFLRELIKGGKIIIHHVPTQQILADCATKLLAKTELGSILQQIKGFSC